MLLNKPNQYGLSAPVGLEQGRFLIVRTADGDLAAVNGVSNGGLFQNFEQEMKSRGRPLSPAMATRVQQFRGGPIKLGELKDFIRAAQGAN